MKCCDTKFEKIIKAARNLDNIADGFGNLMFKNPEIEKLATERAKICAVCQQNHNEWCKMCGCYIPAKVRSRVEMCDGGLW
jgi:hypothetical protein